MNVFKIVKGKLVVGYIGVTINTNGTYPCLESIGMYSKINSPNREISQNEERESVKKDANRIKMQ